MSHCVTFGPGGVLCVHSQTQPVTSWLDGLWSTSQDALGKRSLYLHSLLNRTWTEFKITTATRMTRPWVWDFSCILCWFTGRRVVLNRHLNVPEASLLSLGADFFVTNNCMAVMVATGGRSLGGLRCCDLTKLQKVLTAGFWVQAVCREISL